MISSEDVRHVTFDKAFQGYRREDVDAYLKEVAQTMDDLAAQNDDLQKKLVMLAQRIEKYRTMENSLSTSMINAQRMGDSIIRESKQKAAEIIRSANIKAEDREQRARDDVELAFADERPPRVLELLSRKVESVENPSLVEEFGFGAVDVFAAWERALSL